VPVISADVLVGKLKDALVCMNVDISKCRGQCYDRASNMRGSRSGVAAQICSEEKRAVFTHCYGHALNLAVSNCVKKCKVCSDALDIAFEITKLIKFLRGMLPLIILEKNLKRTQTWELETFALLGGLKKEIQYS